MLKVIGSFLNSLLHYLSHKPTDAHRADMSLLIVNNKINSQFICRFQFYYIPLQQINNYSHMEHLISISRREDDKLMLVLRLTSSQLSLLLELIDLRNYTITIG